MLQAKKMVPPINPMLQMSQALSSHESKLARLPVDSTANNQPQQLCGAGPSMEGMFPGFTWEGPTSLLQAVEVAN